MKNLYIALSFVAATFTVAAQSKDTQQADKLFGRYEYVEAAKAYLKLVENGKSDGYVFKQLADSYYHVFNTAEAEKWYAKAVTTLSDAETNYRYAQTLKANGKYKEANVQMQKFASQAPQDSRAKAFKQNPDYVPGLLGKQTKYTVNRLEISSEKSDFGPVLYQNAFYFTSARNTARKTYGWTEEPYLDIYKAIYNDNGSITQAEPVTQLNSKWHDGPLTLSVDGNTAYFSSESFKENASEKVKDLKAKFSQVYLYKATKFGEGWGNITALPFNLKNYSCANPSLSPDGKTLYFSSNMPNGLGGNDIWKVAINSDGTYGAPENLGPKVNTEANESFPFIAEDNKTLYFASDGRPGLGGLDLFEIDLANGEAVNLGKPVNSEKDDFSFSFNKEKNIGFFASNRNGNDDIFSAVPVCALEVLSVVTDAKTAKVLSGATVSIVDQDKNVIATETTNAAGEVNYRVGCDKAYVIQLVKEGYESSTVSIAPSKGPTAKIAAPLQPIDVIVTETEVVLKQIFFEYNKSNITREGAFELDKLVQVMKSNEKLVILVKSHTDNRGGDKFNLDLSTSRAKSTVQYLISKGIAPDRVSGKGMGKSEPKIDCGNDCNDAQHAENRRSEFLIVKQ